MWFTAPSLAVLGTVLLYPLAWSSYLSLTTYYLPRPQATFTGFANYVDLLKEPRFWHSLRTTLEIAGAAVALEFAAGLAVALALYKVRWGARTFSVLLFIPQIITPVVASLFLRWIFVSRWGLIDASLASVSLSSPNWLGDPFWAKATIVIADGWQFTPFVMLVLYAGLNTMDPSLQEAAVVDGASGWSLLYHVILPMLRPLILFVLVIRAMDAFRVFDSVYVLTGGGPGTATETLTYYTYTMAFGLFQIGRASALGVLTLSALLALTLMLIFLVYRREQGAF